MNESRTPDTAPSAGSAGPGRPPTPEDIVNRVLSRAGTALASTAGEHLSRETDDDGLLEREAAPHGPVDRAVLRTGHHLLHLGAHGHHLPGADLRQVHAAHLGELSGVDAGGAQGGNGVSGDVGAEEGGEHLLDVVEGVLTHGVPLGGTGAGPYG